VTIVLSAALSTRRYHGLFGALLIYLGIYSIHMNWTIPRTCITRAGQIKRISTESLFPYSEALGYVQRQNSGGQFVILGGAPVYGKLLAWMNGFTFWEAERYRENRRNALPSFSLRIRRRSKRSGNF